VGLSFGSLAKQASKIEFNSFLNAPAASESFVTRTENLLFVGLSCGTWQPRCLCLYASAAMSSAKALPCPVVANLNNIQPTAQISPYFETIPHVLDRPPPCSISSGARYASVPRPIRDWTKLLLSRIVEKPKSVRTHLGPPKSQSPSRRYKTTRVREKTTKIEYYSIISSLDDKHFDRDNVSSR
jgi:hypothetical protein